MIQAAKALGGKTKNGAVDYVVSAAEEISGIQGLEEGSVDLLVSAMAVSYYYALQRETEIFADDRRRIGLI